MSPYVALAQGYGVCRNYSVLAAELGRLVGVDLAIVSSNLAEHVLNGYSPEDSEDEGLPRLGPMRVSLNFPERFERP